MTIRAMKARTIGRPRSVSTAAAGIAITRKKPSTFGWAKPAWARPVAIRPPAASVWSAPPAVGDEAGDPAREGQAAEDPLHLRALGVRDQHADDANADHITRIFVTTSVSSATA